MNLVLTLVTTTLCLLLAVIVYVRNEKKDAHKLLAVLSICLALWSVTNWLSLQPLNEEVKFFWIKAVMFVTAPIPLLFFLFTLHFPKFTSIDNRKLKFLISLAVAVTTILMLGAFTQYMFSAYYINDGIPHLSPGPLAVLYGFTFFSLTLAGMYVLLQKYFHSSGLSQLQVAYVLFGLSLTISVGFISNYVLVVFSQNFNFVSYGPASSLFLLACMSYAALRHRLLDLRLVIVKATAYAVAVFVIVGLYSMFINELTELVKYLYPSISYRIVTMIALIIGMTTYPGLLKVTQQLTQRLFHQKAFNQQRAHKILSNIFATQLTTASLLQSLDQFFCTQFGVKFSSVALQHSDQSRLSDLLISSMKKRYAYKIFVTDEHAEGELFYYAIQQNIGLVLPLFLGSELTGYVTLGNKHSGHAFSSEELSFLETIVPELTIAIKHAYKLEKMKDEFVSIASHELRTPMTVIRSYLWLCLFKPNMKLPEKVRQPLQVAYSATERLLNLVQDLLTVSQLEVHHLQLKKEVVNMNQLTQNVVDELQLYAQSKRVTVVVEALTDNCKCTVDKGKISEVLYNIISNAIKFSPNNSTVLVVLGGNNRQLWIKVTDEGVGISELNQQRLFQKFGTVLDSYQKLPEQGTGLGLYISREFVRLHGGDIAVTAAPSEGSTFIVSLPREITDHAPYFAPAYASTAQNTFS